MTEDELVSPVTLNEREISYLLDGVDPKYHDAMRFALLELCNWYGGEAHLEVDEWFTVVYGLVMQLEDVLKCKRRHVEKPINYDDFLELPARINVDDIKPSRDSWTDQYDL